MTSPALGSLPPFAAWLMRHLFRFAVRTSTAPELVLAELEARLRDDTPQTRCPERAASRHHTTEGTQHLPPTGAE